MSNSLLFVLHKEVQGFYINHCVKYHNSMNGTVFAYFRANRPKLYGNYAFPQIFHTRKLGEITAFYAVNFTIKRLIFDMLWPRKFYIRRNQNKVDFIETGRMFIAHLFPLRILTGKKHRQIKLQRLQNVWIWAFGSLVHQINSL